MNINKDVVIIGAGPAGMSAALYLSRTKYDFVICEKEMVGGKLNITTEIENYPGIGKTDGFSIASAMKNQLKQLGIDITKETINDVKKTDSGYELIGQNNTYLSKTIIIATGSTTKKLGIENENKFTGKGISYCAVCDGFFFRNKDIVVFANSRKGYLEALYLSNLVNNLYLVSDVDNDDLEGNLATLKEKSNVIYLPFNKITKFQGEEKLTKVEITNVNNKEIKSFAVEGCFPFVGDAPSNYVALKLGLYMNNNYIITDKFMATSSEGVYAVGDIVDKPLRQIVTACSDGAVAATAIIRYLNTLKNKKNI